MDSIRQLLGHKEKWSTHLDGAAGHCWDIRSLGSLHVDRVLIDWYFDRCLSLFNTVEKPKRKSSGVWQVLGQQRFKFCPVCLHIARAQYTIAVLKTKEGVKIERSLLVEPCFDISINDSNF